MVRHSAAVLALTGLLGLAPVLTGCLEHTQVSRGSGTERLHNAIVSDDVGYVRALIRSGRASPDQRIPAPVYLEGTPLVTIAARAAALNVLQYLIDAGADLNARTPADETALMLACFFMEDSSARARAPHEKAAQLLVEAGADLESAPHGYTALSYAAYQGRRQTVRFLIERGARVDGYARDGISYIPTPLMMAAMMGHRETVEELLRAGANPRIRVHRGHTARELAQKHQQTHLLATLSCAESRPGLAVTRRC
jgi:ankyrin repeat protein